MTDEEFDLLVGQASPISDAQVATLDLGSGDLDLLEAIMSTKSATPIDAARRRRRPLVLATAGLAAAAAAVIGVIAIGSDDKGGGSAYAAELVAVAQANERLLIRGWTVTRADEFSVDNGEMTFTDGSHDVELRWGPAADYASFLADRSQPSDADQLGGVSVLGRPGHLFRYLGGDEYTTLVEPDGPHYLELRGDVGSESAYRDVLDRLHTVDVDTWLGAMPASVVQPGARAATIDQMLVGVPLPAGFDRSTLDSASVSDRYQLGAKVAGAVACGWFDQWFTATASGDTAAATAAADALASSRQWTVLNEMVNDGDFPEVLWMYVDATTGGGVSTGAGSVAITRELVTGAFGCDLEPSVAPTPTVP